ncbi:chemotaxis protein CheW [Halohasta salina]|uniref:chemotaxis protein CheW n=1 Tax=Halohasta salina TaxID=2961621 RepID=UPI0020A5D490|nr:chemotaxis protein CheW [Halohasta salina]
MGKFKTETETKSTESDGKTQVLEFGLDDEMYCLDIDVIDEIVDANDLTPIPNSAPHVEGVMDLRGRTTTIVNPNTVFNNGQDGAQNRIIVLDPDVIDDDTTIGWIVDEVYQVRTVTQEMLDEGTTANDENVNGIVKTDDKFVVWVSPNIATT